MPMTSSERAQVARALLTATHAVAGTLVDDPSELDEDERPHGYFNSVGRATSLVHDIITMYRAQIPHEDMAKLKEAYRILRAALTHSVKLLGTVDQEDLNMVMRESEPAYTEPEPPNSKGTGCEVYDEGRDACLDDYPEHKAEFLKRKAINPHYG